MNTNERETLRKIIKALLLHAEMLSPQAEDALQSTLVLLDEKNRCVYEIRNDHGEGWWSIGLFPDLVSAQSACRHLIEKYGTAQSDYDDDKLYNIAIVERVVGEIDLLDAGYEKVETWTCLADEIDDDHGWRTIYRWSSTLGGYIELVEVEE